MSHERPTSRRIGLFTSGRQDWGILQPVAAAVAAHAALDLTVFISGTHLLEAFGSTHQAVRAGGWRCVDVPVRPSETDKDWAFDLPAMGPELARAIRANPVDVMLLLGDRVETLLAAVVSVSLRCFLAHIHGGDRAPAEFDDAARHAISKLAHVHFPATESSAQRLTRMGESPSRIHMVGSPSIDGVLAGGLAEPSEARRIAGLPPDRPFVVLLHHPAGLGDAAEEHAAREVCRGIADADLAAVCLAPNADPGREAVWETIRNFAAHQSRAAGWSILPTVDRPVFLQLIRSAVALVGNSSAGMVESAAVHAAVVDVGPRQEGREHSANVVHVDAAAEQVAAALGRLLRDEAYAASLRAAPCVFGDGHAAERIARVLIAMDLSAAGRIKQNEY